MSKETQAAQEAPKTGKNFKSSADVENFYRFVYENNLRREAKMILSAITGLSKSASKTKRKRRSKKVQ
ncbi:hypothetical protein HBN50_12320 [Halobacteriovorax sp. GB3]|uniref:hypothetical protein n=1 Tax=Halobacteriovorax sp. GB3 TaxID=2719615 RepID=UPI00235F066A|nr:hypothetical protein [Halobacteriovorax sp. GB3]MDD0853888.1 hypothetical protein [Halobacteriovorax sp. GB3]